MLKLSKWASPGYNWWIQLDFQRWWVPWRILCWSEHCSRRAMFWASGEATGWYHSQDHLCGDGGSPGGEKNGSDRQTAPFRSRSPLQVTSSKLHSEWISTSKNWVLGPMQAKRFSIEWTWLTCWNVTQRWPRALCSESEYVISLIGTISCEFLNNTCHLHSSYSLVICFTRFYMLQWE